MKVLLCYSNLMTEATLNNNLTSTVYKVLYRLLTKILPRLQGCYQLNKHLTIRYSSKRKSNNVRFTDDQELCFPVETSELRIQIVWHPDSHYHKKSVPFLGPLIPSKLVHQVYVKIGFRMPQQCKETLLSENY